MKKSMLVASLGVLGVLAVGCASIQSVEKPADAAPAAEAAPAAAAAPTADAAPAADAAKAPEGSCGAEKKPQ